MVEGTVVSSAVELAVWRDAAGAPGIAAELCQRHIRGRTMPPERYRSFSGVPALRPIVGVDRACHDGNAGGMKAAGRRGKHFIPVRLPQLSAGEFSVPICPAGTFDADGCGDHVVLTERVLRLIAGALQLVVVNQAIAQYSGPQTPRVRSPEIRHKRSARLPVVREPPNRSIDRLDRNVAIVSELHPRHIRASRKLWEQRPTPTDQFVFRGDRADRRLAIVKRVRLDRHRSGGNGWRLQQAVVGPTRVIHRIRLHIPPTLDTAILVHAQVRKLPRLTSIQELSKHTATVDPVSAGRESGVSAAHPVMPTANARFANATRFRRRRRRWPKECRRA